ncbi:DUF2634 domain-containing protein [Paraclostridium sordellii]|uniref:DUF2634 domain-containing protein n=1 Tax=Paraclostridium sordellii TaxID=1505 RepID=UPI0005E2F2A8|nr:DUF2634 domain-containing protein [Paeniclostridium sordellii]MDU6247298.1 DUF2634 domain-containing protein [Paeniclostridium sordellii]MRZ79662.1 DUF2634 domain-containing protein [Paeniclostridium sordellii]MSB57730.1 DUF2634 domain-containing protein [Paeniclostridium sordellii]MVO70964.1 DUF2634 domain-containing protein [Paeniclostridium sordellii]CEO27180.1 phage-like element PBSX protein [[Clostridium] sordellii] [Paeniclostridium sordellii]
MIPNFKFIVSEIEDNFQSSKTYKIDNFNRRIITKIDELDAVKQSVFKILQTERFENIIYDDNYGVELMGYIGKPKEFVKSDIERSIKEALLIDERILGIENFKIINENKDILEIEFKVNSIFGNIHFESAVTI